MYRYSPRSSQPIAHPRWSLCLWAGHDYHTHGESARWQDHWLQCLQVRAVFHHKKCLCTVQNGLVTYPQPLRPRGCRAGEVVGLSVRHNDFRIWVEDEEEGGLDAGLVSRQDGLKPPDCSCGLHLLQVEESDAVHCMEGRTSE